MVPWPIALLSLGFGLLAASSGAMACRIVLSGASQPLIWPAAWFALSATAMCGLALLKPWARTLAVVGLIWIVVVELSWADLFIAAGRPGGALLAAFGAGIPLLLIRYLQRPVVRAYFGTEARSTGER